MLDGSVGYRMSCTHIQFSNWILFAGKREADARRLATACAPSSMIAPYVISLLVEAEGLEDQREGLYVCTVTARSIDEWVTSQRDLSSFTIHCECAGRRVVCCWTQYTRALPFFKSILPVEIASIKTISYLYDTSIRQKLISFYPKINRIPSNEYGRVGWEFFFRLWRYG